METLNIHVPSLYHMLLRIHMEFQKSQSSNSSMLNKYDVIRAKEFFSGYRASVSMVGEPGLLDLPESDPQTYPLRDLPQLADIENQVMGQLCIIMKSMMVELVRSQSSRNSSGLNRHDRRRQLELVDEAERYLDANIDIQPLDFVESSPRAPLQGPGRNSIATGGGK